MSERYVVEFPGLPYFWGYFSNATKILTLVHSDLEGFIQPFAKDGYKYIINFIDNYSGLTMLYFLKHKSNTLFAMKKYLADIAPYGHVESLRTDNGTEFTSEPFQLLLVLNRIKHERSAPYSPHQNETAEWSWQTLFSMRKCLVIELELPKTCGFMQWWLQRILEIAVTIKT